VDFVFREMKVFVNQPQFLPWTGFWNKILNADAYVLYGGVQYIHREYQNRVSYQSKWITLPVMHSRPDLISQVKIAPNDVKVLAKRIKETFMIRKAPYRDRLLPLFNLLDYWESESFLDFHVKTFECLAQTLGIQTKLYVDVLHEDVDRLTKLEHLLNRHGLTNCTLLAGSNTRHFEYEKIPGLQDVLYQEIHEGINPDTILQLIARHPKPVYEIQRAASWVSR
jgi:hypothetical protein